MRALALLATALLGMACFGGPRIPEPPGGAVMVDPETALAFHGRAVEFYTRLIKRRFNTLETFNDLVLRKHFRDLDGFFDYYADLADRLFRAHFEKSRPISVEIEEFLFEDSSRVRVQVRFVGEDRRPMNPAKTTLLRLDLWEQVNDDWWVSPGKL